MGLIAYLSLSGSGREVGWGGRLFEAGRLLTFSDFRMGAYSRWALIRGWALIRINTVLKLLTFKPQPVELMKLEHFYEIFISSDTR